MELDTATKNKGFRSSQDNNSKVMASSGISNQVCALANNTLRFAASAIFRATEKLNHEIDMDDVLQCIEAIPPNEHVEEEEEEEAAKGTTTINGLRRQQQQNRQKNVKQNVSDETKTEAMSIPTAGRQVGGVSSSSITTSTTKASSSSSQALAAAVDQLVTSDHESGYGSTYHKESPHSWGTFNASVRSNLSLLEDIDENDETQQFLDTLPIINLDEVRQHCFEDDAWMVFYDRVYNVTDFLYQHPGGAEVMLDYLGQDGTLAFRSVGHSADALEMLNDYLIGRLPKSQRLYKNMKPL